MFKDIKITVPEDCGNAPKKRILRDFNIFLIIKDYTTLIENIADDITWNIIGDEVIEGKSEFINKIDELYKDKITELLIYDIITHGYVASAHGKVIGTNEHLHFCHIFKFTGASKTAKIKKITSYIIPVTF
jgi:hypothetical protein